MADKKLTTIQTDKETLEKLKELAQANERSATGQLRWLVSEEYKKYQQVKQMLAQVLIRRQKGKGDAKPQSQSRS